ncbi:MAG TPA: hypothetical protein VKB86_04120, partial [Pyrinomonadaceae bacterium]|nr:hypothetical protein [Pyrinomonadaceae bacterium]
MAKITEIIKPKKSSALRRLRVLLITVMLLLIPVLVYSTLYVSNQTDYFNNQNFRQLASISDQIAQRIEGLKIAFDNAIRNTLRKNQAGTPITFQQALGANFEMVDDTPIPKYATQKDMERDLADRKIEINLVTEGEARWLVFVCKLTPSGQDNPQQQSVTFRARTRLDDLVIPLIGSRKLESMKGSEHEGGFDAILIASLKEGSQNTRQQTQEQQQQDDRSKIIFQQGQPELDIASLDNLPRWDDPDKTVDFRNRSRSTSLVEVKLADSNYKLYMQPLNSLPKVSDGDKENQAAGTDLQAAPTRWVICGLVQSSHFRHETMAFSYTLLIIFAFAAAFIALSWPFLRLMFMGCKDRLRLADAYFIAFALLVGSAILTLFILYGFTYRHSENELDEQLKKFSDEINTHFSAEIDRATAEIDALNAKLDSNNLPGKVEVSKKSTNLEGQVNILGSIKDDTYPYFSKASWIDNIGCMKRQWTINGSTSDYICVSDRDYFKKLKEGSSRELNNQRFWLEPINSRLSGEKTVIVSKPIDNKDRKKMGESIVAIDPNMLALMHTVVPPGFGYRVIDISGNDPGDSDKDNPGKVIFQSSETEQQSENFFDECDNDHTLHSLIFGHRKGPVNLNYRGSDHSLYVSPMPGFPNWSLVVFRDKQVLRTVYLQTLALAGIIFLAYAAFFLVAFTIIYLIKINTRNRTEWIWPSREMSDVYYQTFFLNLVLCVVGIIIVSVSDGGLAIASISLIAFIGIFILGMMLKLRTSFKPLDSAVKFFRIKKLFGKGNAYVWNMVMLLILTGILPAAAFFKVAYNQEMRLFVKQEQINIAKEMAGREARIKREELERVESMNLRPLNIGEERDAGNLIDKRLDESLDVYEDFFFKTKHSFVDNGSLQKTRETNDGLVVLFASWVPIFNQTSLEQGGLIPTRAADESWEWL